jgi:hypothetical protein
LESRLRHQLDLVATAAGAKASSNEISAPIDGSGICSSVGDDDGSGNDVNAMHRTEKIELRRSDDVIQSNESPNSRNFGNSQNRS